MKEPSTPTSRFRPAAAAPGSRARRRVLLIAAEVGAPLGIAEVHGVELDRGVPL